MAHYYILMPDTEPLPVDGQRLDILQGVSSEPTPPKTPLELDRTVKEKKWQNATAEINKITDALGKGIDEGVKETVIALNVLGINTTQSCEGHLDWGISAPWVDIGARGMDDVERKLFETLDKASHPQEHHISPQDQEKLYEEAGRFRQELRKKNIEEGQKTV